VAQITISNRAERELVIIARASIRKEKDQPRPEIICDKNHPSMSLRLHRGLDAGPVAAGRGPGRPGPAGCSATTGRRCQTRWTDRVQ
jgi:hypothetical protein